MARYGRREKIAKGVKTEVRRGGGWFERSLRKLKKSAQIECATKMEDIMKSGKYREGAHEGGGGG